MVEWDTDALYLALSVPTIESVIKPTKRAEHNRLLYGECNDKDIKADDKHYVVRQCCQKHSTGDCHILGLFKKEWEGKELLALNSKMYIGTTLYHEKAHQLKSYRHMLYMKLIARACKRMVKFFSKQNNEHRRKKIGYIRHVNNISCKGLSAKF